MRLARIVMMNEALAKASVADQKPVGKEFVFSYNPRGGLDQNCRYCQAANCWIQAYPCTSAQWKAEIFSRT